MPDPVIEKLRRQIAEMPPLTARNEYADGPAYYRDGSQREYQEHMAHLTNLRRQIEEAEAAQKRDCRLIGIARRQLGIPDDSHAARVIRISGGRASSTTDCTAEERAAILAEYRDAGFTQTKPRRAGRAPSKRAMSRATMLRRVEQLLTVQGLPWSYAESILRRQRGLWPVIKCPVDLATDQELRGVIAALYRHQTRGSAGNAR